MLWATEVIHAPHNSGGLLSNVVLWLTLILSVIALGVYTRKAVKGVERAIQERVVHQLWPNGGYSMADKVNRLEAAQSQTQVEIRLVRDLLMTLVEKRQGL